MLTPHFTELKYFLWFCQQPNQNRKMKKNYLRRNFLKNSFLASGGLVLIPTILSASNTEFKSVKNSSNVSDIRKKLFGKQIEIIGQIFDSSGKSTLRGATIEFWHLSPNSNEMGHNGSLLTDENGCYRIVTDYPNREFGKHTTIHYKVTKGEQSSLTELKFSDLAAHITDKHWERNHLLGEELLFPKIEISLNRTKINFNFTINQ